MTTRAPRIALAIAFLLPATTAAAQREGYSYLSYVGSEVSLVSRAEDDSSARLNTPILAGDRISTGSTSRAEAILADGNILRIDVQTNLRFDRLAKTYEAEDDRNSLFLERGAVSLEHRGSTSRDQATRIDTDDVTVVFPEEGLLRVETGRRGTEIYVVTGQAEVYARSGRATLRAGQYVFASGDATLEIDWMDEPRDRFTRFVGERRNLAGEGSGSPYVSAEYGYDSAVADFDQHGSWILVNGSYAWRPSVAIDWRPYVDGYWRWSPAGLTWVSYEPWGWLPYHYGSWDWDVGFGWYWSPGAYYSPAWVYWSYTPSWVGWCPIGYYGGYYGGHHGGGYGGGNGDGHPGPYPRSNRKGSGAERGTLAYPHLRGQRRRHPGRSSGLELCIGQPPRHALRLPPGRPRTGARRLPRRRTRRRGDEPAPDRSGAGRLDDDGRPGRSPQGAPDARRRDPRRPRHRGHHSGPPARGDARDARRRRLSVARS